MKKFLSVLLAVMMVLSMVSFAAPEVADTAEVELFAEYSGEFADYYTWWTLDTDTGVLTIEGDDGDIPDFWDDERPEWDNYADDITSVVVKDGVLSIGAYAFSGCTNLEKIEIPEYVEYIDDTALEGCDYAVVWCYEGSYAHEWAEEMGYEVEFIKVYFTITYDANGGKNAPAPQLKEDGKAVNLTSDVPVRSGYTFLGWATSASATTARYQPGARFTTNRNSTLYAVWEKAAVLENTLTFSDVNAVGGDEIVVSVYLETADEINTIGLAELDYDETVLTFIGFSDYEEIEDISSVCQFDEEMITAAIGFQSEQTYAGRICNLNFKVNDEAAGDTTVVFNRVRLVMNSDEFECVVVPATVSVKAATFVKYDANGGEGAPDAQRKEEGKDLALSATAPVREGYNFVGWATTADAETAEYKAGDVYTAEESITLYAVWEKIILENALIMSGVSAKVGDEISVLVYLETKDEINTIGLAELEYDEDALTFIGFSDYEKVEELASVCQFDEEKITAAIGFKKDQKYVGPVCKLNFRVNEAAGGDTTVVFNRVRLVMNSDEFECNVVPATVSVEFDGVIIDIGEKADASNVRFYEIDGNQYEIVNDNNTFKFVPEKDTLVEIIEKESAESEYAVSTAYYLVDYETFTYKKVELDSFMGNFGGKSLRINNPKGIRFKARVAVGVKNEEEKYEVEEYGFIVAIQSVLEAAGAQLNLNFPMIAKGVAYSKANGTDIVFEGNDDWCTFTGVLTNIPESQYQTVVTSKTYTKINVEGEIFTVYGEAVSASVYEIAKSYLETPENLDDETITELERIVGVVEMLPDNEIGVNGDNLHN